MFTDVSDLKHRDAIVQFFNMLFGNHISQQQKVEIVMKILDHTGITIKDMDDSLEKGLQKGFPIEYQLEAIRRVIESKGRPF